MGDAGFTLIELLVAIALVALVMGAAVHGLRTVAKTDLRNAATKMAGSIRYLFDRASTTGRTHRLVIDFENGKYWAEVSDDKFVAAAGKETDETRKELAEQIAEENEEKKREQEMAEAAGENAQYDPSRYQPKEFKPKRAEFAAFKEMAVKPTQLKGDVKITALFTPRLAEPMSTGLGFVYFFPLGLTEAALVHLSDGSGQAVYTLTVHPLTGRVQVINQYVQPPIDEQFDDEGNKVKEP